MEALKLDHQERRHDEEHGRRHLRNRTLRLGAFLDRAADFDGIPGRQRLFERRNLVGERLHNGRRLRRIGDPGLDRDGRDPVAAPDRRLFELVAEGCDRRQRDGLAAAALQLQVEQGVDRLALLFRGTADHVDQIDVVPDLRYRVSLHDGVQRHRDVLGRDAELSRLVLQHVDLHDAGRFIPVEGEILQRRIGADDEPSFCARSRTVWRSSPDTRY